MTIHNPYQDIVYCKQVETICPSCGYLETRTDLSEIAKRAIVTATQYSQKKTELHLLRRVKVLFELFPDSRHPYIVAKMNLERNAESAPDPTFEAMLDDELRAILGPDRQFYLPVRLAWLEESTPESPPFVTSHKEIGCPNCSHFLILPERFYMMIGSI